MSLPPRGTGLVRGTARPRGYPALTEAQRLARHKAIYGLGNNDTALLVGLASLAIGALLIGVILLK